MPKPALYLVMENTAHGKVIATIFSRRDKLVHEAMKDPIAQVYAMMNPKIYV